MGHLGNGDTRVRVEDTRVQVENARVRVEAAGAANRGRARVSRGRVRASRGRFMEIHNISSPSRRRAIALHLRTPGAR
jgi:hypothetical protein